MFPYLRIVILNFNESHYTVELIDQLKRQMFQNFEIVVVDNKSKDEEIEFLKLNLQKHALKVYSNKNLGYSGGNNLGLKYPEKIKVDYFLVLNNDIIIEDVQFIEKMVTGMQDYKSQNVVASSPLIDTISSGLPLKEQIQVRRIMSLTDTFLINIPLFNPVTKSKFNHFIYRNEMPYPGKMLLCDSINGAAFIIDGDFIRANNYLDEGTFLYYEEIVLGKQILNKGKTCLLNGTTSIQHLQGASTKNSGKKINRKMEKYKYESGIYYLKKYEGMGSLGEKLYIMLSELSIFIKSLIR